MAMNFLIPWGRKMTLQSKVRWGYASEGISGLFPLVLPPEIQKMTGFHLQGLVIHSDSSRSIED